MFFWFEMSLYQNDIVSITRYTTYHFNNVGKILLTLKLKFVFNIVENFIYIGLIPSCFLPFLTRHKTMTRK